MKINFKNRTFKLWKYSVSHSTLIIKSIKNDHQNTNIEISFYGVKLIKIPTIFIGTSITDVSQEYDNDILSEVSISLGENDNIFVFRNENSKYYIVASFFNIEENDKDFFE